MTLSKINNGEGASVVRPPSRPGVKHTFSRRLRTFLLASSTFFLVTTLGVHNHTAKSVFPDVANFWSISSSPPPPAKSRPKFDAGDAACPFREHPLYRKVYIYPTPDFSRNSTGSYLSGANAIYSPNAGRSSGTGQLEAYPWLAIDEETRQLGVEGGTGWGHYDPEGMMGQYTLELIVREVMSHPESCLSAASPTDAALFYVPYMPSMEFHKGRIFAQNMSTSPYAQAVHDAIEGSYDGWEDLFGFTAKYWKRRGGADHILVYSEPLHGLSHPKMRRGNYHFINTQRMLRPPIAVAVEMSTTFVSMYPQCARKNVLVPYPNPDGRWYNGKLDRRVVEMLGAVGVGGGSGEAMLRDGRAMLHTEREALLSESEDEGSNKNKDSFQANEAANATAPYKLRGPRPVSYYYSAGNHGSCTNLRKEMKDEYKCTSAHATLTALADLDTTQKKGRKPHLPAYDVGMRMATFCPCPGGDSPSAKRNFDAIFSGCIPMVLSHDFVWPFSYEIDSEFGMDPNEFSIRWPNANDFAEPVYDTLSGNGCTMLNSTGTVGEKNDKNQRQTFNQVFESISAERIRRLREGVRKAAKLYSFFRFDDDNDNDNDVDVVEGEGAATEMKMKMPDNPLREGVLPDGGAVFALLDALAARAGGEVWKMCQEELEMTPQQEVVKGFKC